MNAQNEYLLSKKLIFSTSEVGGEFKGGTIMGHDLMGKQLFQISVPKAERGQTGFGSLTRCRYLFPNVVVAECSKKMFFVNIGESKIEKIVGLESTSSRNYGFDVLQTPSKTFLFTGSGNGFVRCYSYTREDKKFHKIMEISAFSDEARSVLKLSSRGTETNHLAVAGKGSVVLFDFLKKKMVKKCEIVNYNVGLSENKEKGTLVVGNFYGKVFRIVPLKSMKVEGKSCKVGGEIWSLDCINGQIWIGTGNGQMVAFDERKLSKILFREKMRGDAHETRKVLAVRRLNEEMGLLASCGNGETMKIWDVRNLKMKKEVWFYSGDTGKKKESLSGWKWGLDTNMRLEGQNRFLSSEKVRMMKQDADERVEFLIERVMTEERFGIDLRFENGVNLRCLSILILLCRK